ncbi:MAG: HU family DNA-binding protein [Sulfitobacter sp.]
MSTTTGKTTPKKKYSAKSTAPKSTPKSAEKADVKTTVPTAPAPLSAIGSGSAIDAPTADPTVVETLAPVIAGREMRKKELFDLVTARSGMKKKDVKPVVEALLAVFGEAISEHRDMVLPPLGRLKIQRSKDLKDAQVTVLKLRQRKPQAGAASDTDD